MASKGSKSSGQDVASLAKLLDEQLSLFKKLTQEKVEEIEEQIEKLEDEDSVIFKFERILKGMDEKAMGKAIEQINDMLEKLHQEEWDTTRSDGDDDDGEESESDPEEEIEESDDDISIFSEGSANDILDVIDMEDELKLLIKKRDNEALQGFYTVLVRTARKYNMKMRKIEMFDSEEHLYREVVDLAKAIVRTGRNDSDDEEAMEGEAQAEDEAEKESYGFMVDDVIRELKDTIPTAPDFSGHSKKFKTYKKIVQLLEDHDERVEKIREKANEMEMFLPNEYDEPEEFEKLSVIFRNRLQNFLTREDVEEFMRGCDPEPVKLPNKRRIVDDDTPSKIQKVDGSNPDVEGMELSHVVQESTDVEKNESNFHYPILEEVETMYKEYMLEINSKLDEDSLALAEIRREQRSSDLIIDQKKFERLCREIAQDYKTDLIFDPDVFQALQTASEQYLVDMFEHTGLEAIHRHSQMIQPRDVQIVRRINGERS